MQPTKKINRYLTMEKYGKGLGKVCQEENFYRMDDFLLDSLACP
jgi:hypothetical protein